MIITFVCLFAVCRTDGRHHFFVHIFFPAILWIRFDYDICVIYFEKFGPENASAPDELFAFHFTIFQVGLRVLKTVRYDGMFHTNGLSIYLVKPKSYKWNLIKINVNKSQRLRKMLLFCKTRNFVYLNNNREWSFTVYK